MNTPRIVYKTLSPTTFDKSGELPAHTRRVQIQVDRGESSLPTPSGHYKLTQAIEIIEGNYARGTARYPAYFIVPDVTRKMDEETKEKLREYTAAKKEAENESSCFPSKAV